MKLITKKTLTLFLLITIGLYGCSSDEDTPPPVEISRPNAMKLLDVANAGDASDFEVSFLLRRLSDIMEVRIFIIEESSSADFTLEKAESIGVGNYTSNVSLNGKSRLPSSATDIDGNVIDESSSYVAFALSVATTESGAINVLSSASIAVQLQEVSAVSSLTGFIEAGSGGMDVDANGNVYMADFGLSLNGGGQNVYKVTPQGQVSVFATGMNGASGNDFDAEGNLYQSSITGGYVSRITPDGRSTIVASNIVSPVGLAVLDDGTIYVAGCDSKVSKISPDGVVSLVSDSPLLSCANGIDLDNNGNIYVANFNNGSVIKITPEGVTTIFVTLTGNNLGHLLFKDDLLYVVARGANQIYTVTMGGVAQKLAGSGSRGLDNGSLNSATFSLPNDLAFSPDGTKIYVNDKDPNATGNVISPVVIRVIDIVN